MEGEEGVSDKGKGLLRLKIAKKAYVFDVRRKYAAVRTFNVKKKPETPAQDIAQTISSFFSRKRPEDKGQAGARALGPAPKHSIASTAVKIAAAMMALFLLAVAFVWITVAAMPAGQAAAAPPDAFSGDYNFSVEDSMVLSVGPEEAPQNIGYFLASFGGQGITGLNFSALLYAQKPPTQVFVLDYAREGAYTYPEFLRGLAESLGMKGISVNEIGIEDIQSLPDGAVLLVPTGYFPKELLGIDSNFDYGSLLSRGVAIIYIGYPFDTIALDSSISSTMTVDNKELSFSKNKPDSKDGFNLFDAQYTVAVAPLGATRGFTASAPIYGSVSVVRKGAGTMLFLPQHLDLGWATDPQSTGTQKAIADLTRLIDNAPWNLPFAEAFAPANASSGGALSLYTTHFDADSAYVKVSVEAADKNGIVQKSADVFRLEKGQKSDIVARDELTVPYYLLGQKTRLNIMFYEADQTPVKMYVAMYRDGVEISRSDLEYGLTKPIAQKSVDFEVNALPGDYVVMVQDGSGKVYAATKLSVADLDIAVNSSNWQAGTFSFLLSSAGRPVVPQTLSASMDGKAEMAYTPATLPRTASVTVLQYAYPGKIDPGAHTFSFTVSDLKKAVPLTYSARKNFWENPIVIILGLVSLLVFGIGAILRRPEALRYGLDIPDFPPLSTIKIPIKRETVVEVFNNVNMRYNWKWMPLRLNEIKGGIGKLTYNGKPILVGDFNLDRILSKMKDEGVVIDELDYWGLTAWEKESSHTTHYLTVYRILRNVFVNNAVKFSKIGAMPDCDVKAIIGKEELYLHIMEEPKERVVHRALATAAKGPTIIVFKRDEEIAEFKSMLTSTSKLAVALKMEVNNKNIMLLPVKIAISEYLKQKSV